MLIVPTINWEEASRSQRPVNNKRSTRSEVIYNDDPNEMLVCPTLNFSTGGMDASDPGGRFADISQDEYEHVSNPIPGYGNQSQGTGGMGSPSSRYHPSQDRRRGADGLGRTGAEPGGDVWSGRSGESAASTSGRMDQYDDDYQDDQGGPDAEEGATDQRVQGGAFYYNGHLVNDEEVYKILLEKYGDDGDIEEADNMADDESDESDGLM